MSSGRFRKSTSCRSSAASAISSRCPDMRINATKIVYSMTNYGSLTIASSKLHEIARFCFQQIMKAMTSSALLHHSIKLLHALPLPSTRSNEDFSHALHLQLNIFNVSILGSLDTSEERCSSSALNTTHSPSSSEFRIQFNNAVCLDTADCIAQIHRSRLSSRAYQPRSTSWMGHQATSISDAPLLSTNRFQSCHAALRTFYGRSISWSPWNRFSNLAS